MIFGGLLLLLLGGILFTIDRQHDGVQLVDFSTTPTVPDGSLVATVGEAAGAARDRTSVIEHLRERIAASDFMESAHPSVPREEVAVDPGAESGTTTESEVIAADAPTALLRCGGASDGLAVARVWPREDVSVMASEGVRVVSAWSEAGVPNTLLVLPLSPTSATPSCLDSEVVGVTTAGSLIFNTDAISYGHTNADTLIGFARDGFPIFGTYNGPTDACGGYEAVGGYRYSVSADRNFILGCFSAPPQQFSL